MERFNERDVQFLLSIKDRTIGSCEECSDGWIEDLTPCRCRKSFVFLKELYYSRVPYEFWDNRVVLEKIEPKVSAVVVKKYLHYIRAGNILSGKGLGLLGPNGVGKTTIFSEIGKEAIIRGLKVIYLTAQNYIDAKMLNNYAELDLVEKQSDLILLDEIDKPYRKKGSDYVISQVENLLRETLPMNKVLCLGSNWTEKEINEFFGDSIFSIMRGKIKFLTLLGEDKREEKQDSWLEEIESEEGVSLLSDNITHFSDRMDVKYE